MDKKEILSRMKLYLLCAGIGIDIHLHGTIQKQKLHALSIIICLEIECCAEDLHIHIARCDDDRLFRILRNLSEDLSLDEDLALAAQEDRRVCDTGAGVQMQAGAVRKHQLVSLAIRDLQLQPVGLLGNREPVIHKSAEQREHHTCCCPHSPAAYGPYSLLETALPFQSELARNLSICCRRHFHVLGLHL